VYYAGVRRVKQNNGFLKKMAGFEAAAATEENGHARRSDFDEVSRAA
jgi:hypothetical protein